MTRRQGKRNYNEMTDPLPIWKEKPAGPEQKELNRMFDCKEISAGATAESIRLKFPLFKKFASKVFSAHFRATKAKYGMNTSTIDDIGHPSHIEELGGFFGRQQSETPSPQFLNDDERPISFGSSPFFTWMYTNHEKQCDFVMVALPIISGTTENNFTLSEDGQTVIVTYYWPTALFTATELFKDVSKTDPKVHSFISHMLDNDITEKSKPQGTIRIKLPCRVMREVGAFKKTSVKSGNTSIMLMEFTANQKAKIIDDADTTFNF